MNTPPIQLLSTDFDGTLFSEFENPPIPSELQTLIGQLQANGVTWVINTGRDMAALMECLGRGHLSIRPDYLVLVEREIYRHQQSQYLPDTNWNQACHQAHQTLFQQVQKDLPQLVNWIQSRYNATLYEDTYSPLCLIAANNDEADHIIDYLQTYCDSVPGLTIVRNDVYARFSHSSYSKGTALQEIQRQLQITPQYTAAAGDHFNDLPMLSSHIARYLLSPSNAIPTVQNHVRSQNGLVSSKPCGQGTLDGLQRILHHHHWNPA